MSDILREAAQAAYRAMVAMELSDGSKREWDTAIAGLRAALAEPAIKESLTVQRPWVGLTDDEVMILNCKSYDSQIGLLPLTFYRAIEAKLREKNT